MKEKVKQISRLIAAAQIEDIRLVEASVRSRVRSPKDVGSVDFIVRPNASLKERWEDGTFFVLATIEARLVSSERAEDPAVLVRAEFELKYKLPKDISASKRDLNAFAEMNGVFNVWPYWREFIQSMVTRMNLPPLTLPLFRLADTAKPKLISKEASKAKAG